MDKYLRPLYDWIEEYVWTRRVVRAPRVAWYAKYLSNHDTQAIPGPHASPHLPRDFLLEALPALRSRALTKNPGTSLELHIDSHDYHRDSIKAVWHNDRLHGGTRDEIRLAGLKGSPLLDPENTGSLTLFAFPYSKEKRKRACHVWITHSAAEEDFMMDCIGPVEPAFPKFSFPGMTAEMKLLISSSERSHYYN